MHLEIGPDDQSPLFECTGFAFVRATVCIERRTNRKAIPTNTAWVGLRRSGSSQQSERGPPAWTQLQRICGCASKPFFGFCAFAPRGATSRQRPAMAQRLWPAPHQNRHRVPGGDPRHPECRRPQQRIPDNRNASTQPARRPNGPDHGTISFWSLHQETRRLRPARLSVRQHPEFRRRVGDCGILVYTRLDAVTAVRSQRLVCRS